MARGPKESRPCLAFRIYTRPPQLRPGAGGLDLRPGAGGLDLRPGAGGLARGEREPYNRAGPGEKLLKSYNGKIAREKIKERGKGKMESQVKNIQNREDLSFFVDSQDADFIKEHIGEKAEEFDGFFAKSEDGDFTEVWGMYNIVPWLEKSIFRIV